MNAVSMSTKIAPAAGEDLAGSCVYDLRIFSPTVSQAAVLVIYERGDSANLYDDPDIQEMAAANRLAMVFAHQCNANSYNDIQSDATKGPGRALFAALTQFAQSSGHPELANSSVILYGFSAAGVLAATTTNAIPQRVMGTIQYAMGSAFFNVNSVSLSQAALQVPSLVIANAKDRAAGTLTSLTYFERGRATGAPWGYAVQNNTGHCCNASTKNLILPWIEGLLSLRTPALNLGPSAQAQPAAPVGSFVCTPDGTIDAGGEVDCSFSYAALVTPSPDRLTAWLPNQQAAAAWLRWVSKRSTN